MAGKARIISIANQKGGVGKTTTAVNLGASLAVLERRALVIDLDPQGAVALCFGLDRRRMNGGMLDVVLGRAAIHDLIQTVGRIELGIVPINIRKVSDEEAYLKAIRPEVLKPPLESLRHLYDYIIIDNPPTFGPVAAASLAASDSLLIPVQCEELALRTVGKQLRIARRVRLEQNPGLRLEGMVLTMADARTSMTAQVISTMRRSFGPYLLRTIVPRTVDLARAAAEGEPLVFTRAGARGARSYLRLAGEIMQREQKP